MIAFPDSSRTPTPEQLAAFADGELDPAGRANMERWLIHHPADAAEVEACRRLSRLFHGQPPHQPSEAAWADVTMRIRQSLETERRMEKGAEQKGASVAFRTAPLLLRASRSSSRRRLSFFPPHMLPLTAAAAAIVLAILLYPHPVPRIVAPVVAEEAFEIVAPGDVEIISMSPVDRGALVVGDAPFQDQFVPAGKGDVRVTKLHPENEEVRPISLDRGSFPMILVPVQGDKKKSTSPHKPY